MELTIQKEQDMPLLSRKDLTVRVAHEKATPSRTSLRGEVAKAAKADAKRVVVRRISTEFGGQASIVEASVYKDAAALERFEPEHIRKRHGAEEKPEEAAPAEEKKAAPAEEAAIAEESPAEEEAEKKEAEE